MRYGVYRLMKILPLHTQHGFTLIEMLIAIVVLAIGMLGLARMTMATISVHTATERLARASALLQDSMERIKQAGYGGATPGTVTDAYGALSSYSTSGGTTFNYSSYKRVISIVANTPATNMKTVTVTVSWQHDQQALSASTIVAQ